nr:MAG TPA: hypothetical protein [Caudoviricetes sp.]
MLCYLSLYFAYFFDFSYFKTFNFFINTKYETGAITSKLYHCISLIHCNLPDYRVQNR